MADRADVQKVLFYIEEIIEEIGAATLKKGFPD